MESHSYRFSWLRALLETWLIMRDCGDNDADNNDNNQWGWYDDYDDDDDW